jgi:hypothetical protein
MTALLILGGYGAVGASAAGPPPGTIHSGTSLSDSRIARDAELRPSDFPRGWVSTPGPTTLGHSPCPSVNGAQAAVSAAAISPEFFARDARTAESTTYLYGDTKEATRWFGQLTSRRTRNCVVRTISQSATATARSEGATAGPVRARRLATPPIGDETAGTRLSIRISSGGIGLDADADLIFVRVGRSIVVFDFGGVGSPFGRGLESKLMGTVALRLARDLAGGS